MKSPSIAKSQWAGCITALSLLIVVVWSRTKGGLGAWHVDRDLQRLRAQQVKLSAFSESALEKAKATALAFSNPPPKPSWPQGWSVRDGSPDDQSLKIWDLQSGDAPGWDALVQAITRLSSQSANRIVALDIRSRGSLTEREVAFANIRLEHVTETQLRRSDSVATRFLRSSGSAKTPKLGFEDTLRGDDLLRRPSPSPLLSSPTTGVPRPVVPSLSLKPRIP